MARHLESDEVHLNVRVQPRSSRNALRRDAQGHIKIALTAPPVDGEANAALRAFLAERLGVSKSAVTIVRGQTSREKMVTISGVSQSQVDRLLAEPR